MEEERKYRIADPVKGDSILYTLEQLKHLKNNHKITADTLIRIEGEEDPFPAGALFDFTVIPAMPQMNDDVVVFEVVSMVLCFFLPLAGLIVGIIGYRKAAAEGRNRNLLMAAIIINSVLLLGHFII